MRVRALAAAELDRAEGALEHARAAARAGAPPDQVEHLAYVVSQRAALADARAAERVARSEIGKLQRALGQALAHGRRLERDRPARAPLEQAQRQRASVRENEQVPTALHEVQRERAAVQKNEQAHAPLEQDQGQRTAVQDGQQAGAPLGQNQQQPGSVQEYEQARAPLEQDQQGRAAVQENEQAHAPLGQDQQQPGSAQEDQQAYTAEPDSVAAIVETVPQDITLSLAQLPFDGAAPTSDTLEELAALAERLLREPGPSVVIEADFDLPDPEARTMTERRVEVVRAILLRRGIEPARLVVRAAGDGPVEPPATSSFVESP